MLTRAKCLMHMRHDMKTIAYICLLCGVSKCPMLRFLFGEKQQKATAFS